MKGSIPIVLLMVLLLCGCLKGSAQSVQGIVNSYFTVTTVNTSANSLIVDNAAGLTSGQRILLIQAKGASINSANASAFGDITNINSAGNYEFNTVCNVINNEVWLKDQLANSYDPAGQLQMVSVLNYQSVTLSGGISSSAWDPVSGKGGIVAIEAADTIYLNADIDVSGQGFKGGNLVNYPVPQYNCDWFAAVTNYYLPLPASGDYTGGKKGEGIAAYILNEEYGRGKLANGGGGGNNANTGGAGGGHYGAGGAGGERTGESTFSCHGADPGIGGLSLATYGYTTSVNRIFFGGGGGSGHENNGVGLPGGNGGGIIILSASVVMGNGGRLMANGVSPLNPANSDPTQAEGDGGGGGGAGGTVIINAAVVTGLITAQANGARGSDASNLVNDCTGPGGGGGGGVIWAAGSVFPAAVSASINGGPNGVVSSGSSKTSCVGQPNGAGPGQTGSRQASYAPPPVTAQVCIVLASSALKYFTGRLQNQEVLLSWALYQSGITGDIRSYTIERSVDQVNFTALATLPDQPGVESFRYSDQTVLAGTVLYRLEWTDRQGSHFFSPIVALTRNDIVFLSVRLHPNPARDLLGVDMFSQCGTQAVLRICNVQGQLLFSRSVSLHTGANSFTLPVQSLASGIYFLVIETKEWQQVVRFLKQE
ncbi:T9SS type A sorting domain-containing protein [Flavitalea flava]